MDQKAHASCVTSKPAGGCGQAGRAIDHISRLILQDALAELCPVYRCRQAEQSEGREGTHCGTGHYCMRVLSAAMDTTVLLLPTTRHCAQWKEDASCPASSGLPRAPPSTTAEGKRSPTGPTAAPPWLYSLCTTWDASGKSQHAMRWTLMLPCRWQRSARQLQQATSTGSVIALTSSESSTGTPRARKKPHTVLLPMPMLPVRPSTKGPPVWTVCA